MLLHVQLIFIHCTQMYLSNFTKLTQTLSNILPIITLYYLNIIEHSQTIKHTF